MINETNWVIINFIGFGTCCFLIGLLTGLVIRKDFSIKAKHKRLRKTYRKTLKKE